MDSSNKSYFEILKSTSLLGGVQVLNLIVGLFRNKISAILIGVDGMGLVALFNSIIDLLRPIFNLGLNTSAVKDISQNSNTQDKGHLNKSKQTIFTLLILLGGSGAAFLFLFSDYFSIQTFGSLEYSKEVKCLSILLISTAIFNGYMIIFQGMRQIKLLALCNAGSGIIGLIIMIPIYYYLGTDGIVLYLVANGIVMALFAIVAGRKLRSHFVIRITFKELWNNGRMMLRMGLLLTINGIFGAIAQYYLRQHLLMAGGLEVVGLFAASITILEGYGGILFSAMNGDFYPRLSCIHNDRTKTNELLKHQIEVGVLIVSLIVIFLITFSPLVIHILFTSEYITLTPIILWGAIALVIKAIFTPLDYILIAKEELKWVMVLEILSSIFFVTSIGIGYRYGGMTGIGIGYLVTSLLNWIQIQLFIGCKYKMKLSISVIKLIAAELSVLASLLLITLFFGHNWIIYTIGGICLLLQLLFSVHTLQKKSGSNLRKLINSKLRTKSHL